MTAKRQDVQWLHQALGILERLSKGVELFGVLRGEAENAIRNYHESLETRFSEWLRCNPRLDSKALGLSIHDLDWIIHQYRTAEDKNGPRMLHNFMLLEEKRFGAECSFAQKDTFSVLDQCLKRRATVFDSYGNKITVRYYGFHTLQFSGAGPEDGERILWDKKEITKEVLESLIRFELHPCTLLLRDTTERRHHANKNAVVPLFPKEAS